MKERRPRQQLRGRHTSRGKSECQEFLAREAWLLGLRGARGFNRWVVEEIAPWVGKCVLDIGCGIGTLTAILSKRSKVVVGVERDGRFAGEAALSGGSHVVCGEVTDVISKLPMGFEFDTIVALDVLEHVENEVAFLANFDARLSSDGKLIVKVPAIPALYCELDRAVGHLRRYDSEHLWKVPNASGFEVITIFPFNAAAVFGWWFTGRILRRRLPPRGAIALFDRFVPIFRRFDKTVRPLAALSLIAIARKTVLAPLSGEGRA